MEKFNSGKNDIFKLEIDQDARNNFIDMARWTKFLSVFGFVILGLLMAMGLFFGLYINKFAEMYGSASPVAALGMIGPIVIILMFVLVISIYIYPIYALLKFSSGIRNAMISENKELFNRSVKHLRNMFRYMGIVLIISLGLYGIQIFFVVLSNMNK